MMSRIAPRGQRTSLVSAAGGNWKCMPRRVPLRVLEAMFAWAISGFRACAPNSFWQNIRAKKPRSSPLFSRSRMKAPRSAVSVKIIVPLGSLSGQKQFACMEAFGPARLGARLDAAQAHQSAEGLGGEPALAALCSIALEQNPDLAL